MGKPYSDLEKQALAIIRSGGNPAASADKGLANYWEWRMNPADSSHNLPAGSERPEKRKLVRLSILPFATLPLSTARAKVTTSERSSLVITAALKTAAGVKTITEEPTSLELGSFKPARVYWRTGAATAPQPRVSRITKRSYKSVYAESDQGYSIPFGKTGAGDTLVTTQQDIRDALTGAGSTVRQITFSPEKYRG